MRATLLLPAAYRFAGRQGVLARWIARGDRVSAQAAGRDAILQACFQFIGTTVPAAALTRNLDAGDAADAQWLRCDPACIVADAVTLRLVACGEMGLSRADVGQLASLLKPIFGDTGFLLEATRSDRWYLRCPREARFPTFSSPDDALGDDLARHMPRGDSAARFCALLNEVQIALTHHPVNEARARRRLPVVNSVWFWGAGKLPEWVRSAFELTISNDETLRALSVFAKVAVADIPPTVDGRATASAIVADFTTRTAANVLIDLAYIRAVDDIECAWIDPLDARLRAGAISEIMLRFESGELIRVKASQRWRFWRRVRPLA